MGNETERPNTTGTTDPSKKDPSHQGGQIPAQQDPSKKSPSHDYDPRQRDDRDEKEGSGEVDKRRAS